MKQIQPHPRMPVFVQCSESQGVRGPPSAVRAVLPEPRAELITQVSFTAMLQVTLLGTKALSSAQSLRVKADPLRGAALHVDSTYSIYCIREEQV